MSAKILMSVDNPTGHKLEELLLKIKEELQEKTDKIEGSSCPVTTGIQYNNKRIMTLLDEAIDFQNNTMDLLDSVGENNGPHGSPRI